MFRIILFTALISQTFYGKIAYGRTTVPEDEFLNRSLNTTLQKSFYISFIQLNVNDCQDFCDNLQTYFGVRPDCNRHRAFELKKGSHWRRNECGSWCEQAISCDIGYMENCPPVPAWMTYGNAIQLSFNCYSLVSKKNRDGTFKIVTKALKGVPRALPGCGHSQEDCDDEGRWCT